MNSCLNISQVAHGSRDSYNLLAMSHLVLVRIMEGSFCVILFTYGTGREVHENFASLV